MVLNRVWLAAIGLTALAWSGALAAQQYRAGEYLNLDLSRAALSPKLLGPATGFTPGPLDVTIDRGKATSQADAEQAADSKTVLAPTVHVDNESGTRTAFRPAPSARKSVAHASPEQQTPRKPRVLATLHGRNPIEAQARDTHVQVWPCRSGGICNWKR